MKIVCISDTHNQHRELELPEGDILIHAGDFCHVGTEAELIDFDDWLGSLSFKQKLVVQGNHDDVYGDEYELQNGTMIGNKIITLDKNIKIGGLDYFNPAKPYNLNGTVDILISHEPPFGIYESGDLEITEIANRITPLVHVFGHLHYYGIQKFDGRTFINAALCDIDYRLVNKAVILEF